MQNISEIEELIKLISKLPGLGPKSAKRIVLKLIKNRDELVKPMASTLAQVYKNVMQNFPDAELVDVKLNKKED